MSVPRQPIRPGTRPMRQTRRIGSAPLELADRLRSGGTWVFVVLSVLLGVFTLYEPVNIWVEQQIQISSLQKEVEEAKATLAESQANIERWSDRSYIEAQARSRLMFVYPGDISYLVVNDVNTDGDTAKAAKAEVTATSINWLDSFLRSYALAASVGGKNK